MQTSFLAQAWACAFAAGAVACGASDESPTSDPLSAATTGIFLQVAYMPGAEPYTGGSGRLTDYWSISRSNLEALFPDKPIRIDDQLSAMTPLSEMPQPGYSAEDIVALADLVPDHRQAGEARFLAIWLDGYFEEDGDLRTDVLGVAIGGADIVAMFKPVIATSEIERTPLVAAFVEQSTLVHEVGHALGLVNNGLPLTSDHHDEAHGAHCTNRDCIMFYLNEGLLDLRDFVQQYLTTSSTLLFGPACLADVDAARETPADG